MRSEPIRTYLESTFDSPPVASRLPRWDPHPSDALRLFPRSHASPCPSESMHTHHPAAVRAHSSSGTLIHACMLLKLRNVP
jgi:hypothetical protein